MARWYNDTGMQGDIVISTRVRLARNISGLPFQRKETTEDAQKVIDLVANAIVDLNYKFDRIDVNSLSDIEKKVLIEERYISPNLAKSKIPTAVFISEDKSVSIMVNEEDHIRLQAIFAGKECEKAYDIISKTDEYLSKKLNYAVHQKYGYLTSCLTNVGTGMRVSYMMHLPAIVNSGVGETLFGAVSKLGVTVRGIYGEGTKSGGNLFQISNQTTLGKSEEELMDNLSKVVDSIIEKERELRTKMLKEKGFVMEDQIMRSYGILKTARLMQSSEMMNLLSNMRIGVVAGMIKDVDAKMINNIMVNTSPAHISGENITNPIERDIERARLIREMLSNCNS